jgi:type II secretion system protein H
MRTTSRQAGFTLVEVMVVTVVIGITLAASIPSFAHYMQANRLDSAGKQVTGHFKLARAQAVAEGVPYLILWSNYTWYYTIRDTDRNGVYTSGEPYVGPIYLPKGVYAQQSIGFTSSYLSLFPNGSASSSVSFELIDDDGQKIAVTLLPSTGQLVIDKDPQDGA